jgi:hypothetical protein
VDSRWVVEVLGVRSGSGCLLSDVLVLTAAHLLTDRNSSGTRALVGVSIRLQSGDQEFAARRVWSRYEGPDWGVDAALLEITDPAWITQGLGPVRWGRLEGSAEIRLHAFGFPDAAVREGRAELSPVTGSLHTESGRQSGRPEIIATGEPERGKSGESLWAGMPGGPVLAAPDGVTSDVLLGIVTGDPAEFASRRLRMVPVSVMLDDQEAAAVIARHCGQVSEVRFPLAWPAGALMPLRASRSPIN